MSVDVPGPDQTPPSEIASDDGSQSARRSHLTRATKLNIVVCGVVGLLCAVALDGGVTYQIWYFAMAAYWSATLLIWSFHRNSLSRLDLFVVRWGFWVALFTVPFLTALFWRLYGGGAPLREWFAV
jgi:hypothetical protein